MENRIASANQIFVKHSYNVTEICGIRLPFHLHVCFLLLIRARTWPILGRLHFPISQQLFLKGARVLFWTASIEHRNGCFLKSFSIIIYSTFTRKHPHLLILVHVCDRRYDCPHTPWCYCRTSALLCPLQILSAANLLLSAFQDTRRSLVRSIPSVLDLVPPISCSE